MRTMLVVAALAIGCGGDDIKDFSSSAGGAGPSSGPSTSANTAGPGPSVSSAEASVASSAEASSVAASSSGGLEACAPSEPGATGEAQGVFADVCANFSCLVPPHRYILFVAGPPPLADCIPASFGSGDSNGWCCATLTCVRNPSYDSTCQLNGNSTAYACPAGSQPGLPNGCVFGGAGNWCCP